MFVSVKCLCVQYMEGSPLHITLGKEEFNQLKCLGQVGPGTSFSASVAHVIEMAVIR